MHTIQQRAQYAPLATNAVLAAQSLRPRTRRADAALATRRFANGLTFFLAALTVALVAAGGTHALWSTQTTVNGGTLSTGTMNLTINGLSAGVIAGLDTSKLSPGRSVTTTALLANSGSASMDVRVASVVIGAATNGLDAWLDLRTTVVDAAGSCAPGLTGQSGRLSTFSTSGSGVAVPGGTSAILCLELSLSPSAPATTQGGTTVFTINFNGNQKAKA